MNCAWCGANDDGSGSHGICDTCMALHFGVNPAKVHAEMAAESKEEQRSTRSLQAPRHRRKHFQRIQQGTHVASVWA